MKEFTAEMPEPAGINYYFNEEGLLDHALNPNSEKHLPDLKEP